MAPHVLRAFGAALAAASLLACARPPPAATPEARSQARPTEADLAAGPGGGDLVRATRALGRFRDPAVALREGYQQPRRNDGFQMGEHWHLPELLRAPRCELERPAFLQYLVIDGQRQLIGTGYVCDAGSRPPEWFDGAAVWHEHGPALCRWERAATIDAQPFAEALPNALEPRSWQALCEDFSGEPLERRIVMLHTWNWIPAPDGPFAHENRAIPFLRAGLRVPTKAELDAAAGQDALAALSLAQGDVGRRLAAGFLAAGFGLGDWISFGRILARERSRGEEAVAKMRTAEAAGDAAGYASAAAWGAAARVQLEREVAARLAPVQRLVVERFVASLRVHDHAAQATPEDAAPGHEHAPGH